MTYCLNIDWLAIHCHYCPTSPSASETDADPRQTIAQWQPVDYDEDTLGGHYPFRYKLAEYGTRQFSRLHFVSMPNAEGGRDDFAEVQSAPFSGILNRQSVIVRFVNRVLYLPDFWQLVEIFLRDNNLVFQGVSRIDICADFNDFACIAPRTLIEQFAAKKLRHVGRGVGALYFDHGVRHGDYGVEYTGLSFGTHTSDARIYLYNKSKELKEVKDKPYIRDTWTAAGLDVRNVWRLEVSVKSKGCQFKCKATGKTVTIDTASASDEDELAKIYHSFVAKMFAFVQNRKGITNITREPRLPLFGSDAKCYQRAPIRNVSCSNKTQRMIIKALYQLGDLYRGASNIESADLAQSFAVNIAESTDLAGWMSEKLQEWERPTHL